MQDLLKFKILEVDLINIHRDLLHTTLRALVIIQSNQVNIFHNSFLILAYMRNSPYYNPNLNANPLNQNEKHSPIQSDEENEDDI